MAVRVTRADLTARNRETLLEAARTVFLERGFHGASLEAIAVEAGFSKGLVYSQFDSKADLFLALLEKRQAERAATNLEMARARGGRDGLFDLLRYWRSTESREADWTLLVVEFRVHAARDPAVGRRYGELHRRTIEGLARTIEELFGHSAAALPLEPAQLASLLLAIGSGAALESAADRDALPLDALVTILDAWLDGGAREKAGATRRSPR